MLILTVKGTLGDSIRDTLLPEMLNLAQKLNVQVESEANGNVFRVRPSTTIEILKANYNKLFPGVPE